MHGRYKFAYCFFAINNSNGTKLQIDGLVQIKVFYEYCPNQSPTHHMGKTVTALQTQ